MNKENSIGTDNEPSTQINDSIKSYTSRYKHLKMKKQKDRSKNIDVVPYRKQKAATTIQRYWRFFTLMRRKVYQEVSTELNKTNQLLNLENRYMDRLIELHERECREMEQLAERKVAIVMKEEERDVNQMLRKLVGITFKMQKKVLTPGDVSSLAREQDRRRKQNGQLTEQKCYLQQLLAGQLQEQEQLFLKQIKEENMQLLRISKERNECEKLMKRKFIATCKLNLNTQ